MEQHSRTDVYADRYAARAAGMVPSEIRALFAMVARPEIVSLAGGAPYVSALPLDAVGQMIGDLVAGKGAEVLQYGSAQGDELLREHICEVMSLEGVQASPDDVVVTVGAQQALDLITKIFVDPGTSSSPRPVLCRCAGHVRVLPGRRRACAPGRGRAHPVRARETLSSLRAQGRRVKFLYTVPTFQNPAGVTLTTARRAQILEICAEYDVLIVEDNPYGLLGFDGEPMRALRADDSERVLYLGSFSKTIASGLRVGWVLAPHAVRAKLVLAAESAILCPSNFSQFAVREYLATQPWREQTKGFRELYRARRDAMLESLDQLMPDGCTWTRPAGGFFVWLTLPEGLDAKAMAPRAIAERVAYVPGTGFFADGTGHRHMRLSYCFPSRTGSGRASGDSRPSSKGDPPPRHVRRCGRRQVHRLPGAGAGRRLNVSRETRTRPRWGMSLAEDERGLHRSREASAVELGHVVVLAGGCRTSARCRSGPAGVTDALRARDIPVELRDADATLLDSLTDDPPDIVFPVLHGAAGRTARSATSSNCSRSPISVPVRTLVASHGTSRPPSPSSAVPDSARPSRSPSRRRSSTTSAPRPSSTAS